MYIKMKLHKYILFLGFLFYFSISNAQLKYEKEYRIKPTQIPTKAKKFIATCDNNTKIKWYAEESQDGKSFEAKFKVAKKLISVEFDTLGNIQDVEKKVNFKKLDTILKNSITKSLQQAFTHHKIVKTQIQWIADTKTLIELIKTSDSQKTHTKNYEIVLKGTRNNKSELFEVLLDANFTVVKVLKIKQRDSSNLEF